jgi:CheY-like chemotaxis protein
MNIIPHVKHALIIDDSEDMQELLTLLLQSKGYRTDCTSNGEEALSLLNSSEDLPSVILVDYRMPQMDGCSFIQYQRESPRLRHIPVIMMTAEDDIESLKKKTNILQILVKPLSMASLLHAVDKSNYLH